MTCLKSSLPASGTVSALYTHAQPLNAKTLLAIECAAIGALAILGRELFEVGLGMAPEPALNEAEAAELEYASWMPDPGVIEVASWAANLRCAVR